MLSLLTLPFALKLVEILRESQGFGSGAAVKTSGEIEVICRLFAERKNEKLNFFDVGANRGEYTQALAQHFPTTTFFLFEPSPTTFSRLLSEVRSPQAVAMNFGLGKEEAYRPLYKESIHARIGSLTKFPTSAAEFTESVKIRTLDSVVHELNIDRVDLLKLDVEGHELDVLRGATELLEKRTIKVIQFEFGEFNVYSRILLNDLFDFLNAYGFSIAVIKFGRLIHLENYQLRYEIFAPTNYVATLNHP